jgi:hypothetical protein
MPRLCGPGRRAPTERYVIDECRRQHGRRGKNLPIDLNWFMTAANITARHRGPVTHALRTLYAREFLIPTNQQFDISADSKELEVRMKNNSVDGQENTIPPDKPKAVSLADDYMP